MKNIFKIGLTLLYLHSYGAFADTTGSDQPLKDSAMMTLMGTYTFTSFAVNLQCYIDNNCNLNKAEELVAVLRDALEPLCDMDKPYNEYIAAVMHAGMAGRAAITAEDSKCINGKIDLSGTGSTTDSPHLEEEENILQEGNCIINKDLKIILEKFPDMHSIVKCQSPESMELAEGIIVDELAIAVCKTNPDALRDMAQAAENIDERLRQLDARCYNETLEAVCKRLN